MRVLIIDSGQSFGQGGGWFDTEKCINGFRGMGMHVVCLGRDAPESITIENLNSLVVSFKPDLIFCPLAQTNYGFYLEVVKSGITVPVVMWNGTDDEDFTIAPMLALHTTLYCSASSRRAQEYRNMGSNAIFLPFAADSEIFFPQPICPEYESDLCYVGVPFGNKTELLLPLEKEYKCCFKFGASLMQKEVAKVYCSAKIALSPATHQDIVVPGLAGCSWNSFEAPATGAFLLQRDRPDLHLLYRENEIATFDGTFADLKAKIDYYLQNEEERKGIAEKAYQRTISEHLIQHRLKKVLERLAFYHIH